MSSDATPFHDLDAFLDLPRLSGLVLSPDGERLVTAVACLDPKRTRFVSALWEVDPAGQRPAHRLTRSAKGEQQAAFLPDGGLLFTSARPDPEAADADDEKPALWLLPAGRGEARVLATRPGGITGVTVARDTPSVVVTSPTLPAAVTAEDDATRRAARKDRRVAAILHDGYPIRYWDHDLGPDQPRLLAGRVPPGEVRADLRDLTPDPGRALDECDLDLTPDGRVAVTSWLIAERGGRRETLVAIDLDSRERRVLLDDPEREFGQPRVSPDGSTVAVRVFHRSERTRPPDVTLGLVDLASGGYRDLAPGWDRWPGPPVWTPDGTAVLVVADEDGGAPVFRIDVATGAVTRLTGDRAAYSDVQVSADGRAAYALRAAVDSPPAPVRFDPRTPDQAPVRLPGPAPEPALPGRLDEVVTTAADGVRVRAWLALPAGASAANPAPLLLWIHGGPLGSWNTWAWRWNPWLAVARGYAVLLPDPRLSTGYGLDFVRAGWGRWGQEPYHDLMAVTDVTLERGEVDATRTAAMGGSFGGYMANWVAGHTDRFRAIVSHAGLWALDQFGPTTDAYDYWRREMSPEMVGELSPHRFVDEIRTPMLVVHGDRDYRVPIGEAVRLWAELAERSADDGTMPHRFLYFPDENHWILQPQHVKVWYETVFAFLAHQVLGEEWRTPEILR